MTIEQLKKALDEYNASVRKSTWSKGVSEYSYELLDNVSECIKYGNMDALANTKLLKDAMLNGADSWAQYSWGGCSFCYDGDIAKALCSPSELKKTRNGSRRPNASEEWLDVQARALYQASLRVIRAFNSVKAAEC